MYSDLNPNRGLFGLYTKWIIFGAFLVALLLLVTFGLNWFAKPLEMADPDNLSRLSRQANEAWSALKSKQANIAGLESKTADFTLTYGEDRLKWPQGKSEEFMQTRQQLQNLKISYNADCGQYNALWQDEWRSVVAPKDLPTKCELMK